MTSEVNPDETTAVADETPDHHAKQRSIGSAMRRVMAPFWTMQSSRKAWVAVMFILASMAVEATLGVQITKLNGELSGQFVSRNEQEILRVAGHYFLFVCIMTANFVLFEWLRQSIMIDWRKWLVGRFQSRWLDNANFYRMERQGGADNPDQRIADDTYQLVDHSTLLFTTVGKDLMRLVGYATVLLSLGGALDLRFLGVSWVVPGGTFLLALVISIVVTALGFAIGRPLVGLSVAQQRKDADLRFALAAMRANAEQIALYRGEGAELQRTSRLLAPIADNWHRIIRFQVRLVGFQSGFQSLLVLSMPLVGIQAYLNGSLSFANLYVVGFAFMMVINGFTTLLNLAASGEYYRWASAVHRLDAFDIELDKPEARGIALTERESVIGGPLLETSGLQLARPDGTALAAPGDLAFRAGERWLVRGESGVGKSMMMRAIAGLWPHGSGSVSFNAQTRARTLFLPQKSYVPTGTLIDALSYPAPHGSFTHEQCRQVLRWVHLEGLTEKLDTTAVWQQQLSPGEQQRLAFARVFLHAPEVVLLDEATSALDPTNETRLYALLDEKLPDALVISIAHRDALEAFHSRSVRLTAASQVLA
ncbi:ATP-binding cassette domain-containing protein [Xanthomonas cannabis]|uniref:ATP-binding cassette domain-containing protein n=1 Tax=Xanthomonas cannabis TaxID=1885674 RepID=UPI00141BF0E8|nr:putative ATP-binding cassette transporter [Xanthomonas cannabis]NIK65425.1 putative ATP-binding cassette transporter [Xanthomonas cannabis]